jgi:hypothetical protein
MKQQNKLAYTLSLGIAIAMLAVGSILAEDHYTANKILASTSLLFIAAAAFFSGKGTKYFIFVTVLCVMVEILFFAVIFTLR